MTRRVSCVCDQTTSRLSKCPIHENKKRIESITYLSPSGFRLTITEDRITEIVYND